MLLEWVKLQNCRVAVCLSHLCSPPLGICTRWLYFFPLISFLSSRLNGPNSLSLSLPERCSSPLITLATLALLLSAHVCLMLGGPELDALLTHAQLVHQDLQVLFCRAAGDRLSHCVGHRWKSSAILTPTSTPGHKTSAWPWAGHHPAVVKQIVWRGQGVNFLCAAAFPAVVTCGVLFSPFPLGIKYFHLRSS